MSIPVSRIVKSLRYVLNDMQSTTISDFELIEDINQAAALLYGMLSEKYVHAAMKTQQITVDDTNIAELPEDFVRVHQVGLDDNEIAMPVSYMANIDGAYRIIGTKFKALAGTYDLEYYYIPQRVTKLADDLDIPQSMSTYIEQIAIAIYQRDLARASQLAQAATIFLSDSEVSHLENNTIPKIMGGKL